MSRYRDIDKKEFKNLRSIIKDMHVERFELKWVPDFIFNKVSKEVQGLLEKVWQKQS